MNSTNATELERMLLRSGDDIYRLALLLSADEPGAAQALIKAIRRLATSGTALDQPALLQALLQALPPERRRWRQRRPPAWTHSRAVPAGRAALLAALAALPRAQRLGLGLTMLRAFESAEVAALRGDEGGAGLAKETSPASGTERAEASQTRAVVRDALLALAPIALPSISPAALDSADAPEACHPTRAAIALNDPALHTDATIRGHLALCSACRAAEHAWQSLSIAVEEALRGALRETRLPQALADQLLVASQPTPVTIGWGLLASPRARIALVALPVLALIAFLVWPRGVPTTPTGSAPALAQAPAARDLVQRAGDQLYLPPVGQGAWHSRYEVQWAFADETTALLAGDLWVDSASGRHRIQLVHHSGGGPYEFELADGKTSASYAVSPNYQPSLYPLSYNLLNRVKIDATPAAQIQMLAARLQSGAWGIAGTYLRQAETAELRTWGRQRDTDGALLDLISFNGISPLALPADAPNATTSRVTVLLAIDEASGRLREVRELIGPAGSEQTTRITWRQVSEEWLNGDPAVSRAFNLSEAWNGVGSFTPIGTLVDPALPLLRLEALTALVNGYQLGSTGLWMPASAPSGTSSAFLLNHNPSTPIQGQQIYNDSTRLTFVYLAPGRRLEVSTVPNGATPLDGGEVLSLNDRQVIILPHNGQSYQAQINHTAGASSGNAFYTTQVAAFGYTRAELLEVLRGLGSPTLASYLAQARLFADPGQHDSAAFDALLTALAPVPAGTARHFVEQIYRRHDQQPDALHDPYHRPRYGGLPEQLIQDNWVRNEGDPRAIERVATSKGIDDAIYGRQYLGPNQVWYYDAPASRVSTFPTTTLGPDARNNEDQNTIIRMIACGAATLETQPNGGRRVTLTESNWLADGGGCVRSEYSWYFHIQTTDDSQADPDSTPYLADRTEARLTTLVDIAADGRARRIQSWAGSPDSGTLLESWELVSDETMPAERVPAAVFDPTPPDALLRLVFKENVSDRPIPHSVTITQALELAQTPLFELSPAPVDSRTVEITTTGELTPAGPGTAGITKTGELTPTEALLGAPPLLNSIAAGAPAADPQPLAYNFEVNVFERALKDGYAIRFGYIITATDGSTQNPNLYQGSAKLFGAYLRASAVWKSSGDSTWYIGGKQVYGWRITERSSGTDWLLFELDGTLIAVESPSVELLDALGQMQPVTR